MSKKIGIGYSFKEKSLEKENQELKAKIQELLNANKETNKTKDKKNANKETNKQGK